MTEPPRKKEAVRRQRAVEEEVLTQDANNKQGKSSGAGSGQKKKQAIQLGARNYPEPPFAQEHIRKPGRESELDPPPMYDAPYYRGSGKLEDKVAIITGADSGIGRAVAVLFAREGADVVVMHLDEPGDADVTRRAVEGEGRQCLVIAGDVSDQAHCKNAVKQTIDTFGKLDILVNNAAFQMHTKEFTELTAEHFDLTLKTNLYGYFFMAQAAAEHMQEGGVILNTGSVTGIQGSGEALDYATTKGGIHMFTRSLASNLLKKGIRVNAVAPGPVWTPLNPADRDGKSLEKFGSSVPMKRPAQPEEIAPAFVFLASSHCSSYITGEILPVIGGY